MFVTETLGGNVHTLTRVVMVLTEVIANACSSMGMYVHTRAWVLWFWRAGWILFLNVRVWLSKASSRCSEDTLFATRCYDTMLSVCSSHA